MVIQKDIGGQQRQEKPFNQYCHKETYCALVPNTSSSPLSQTMIRFRVELNVKNGKVSGVGTDSL